MDLQRVKHTVERKDEQLDASRRLLEAQEDELVVSVLVEQLLLIKGQLSLPGSSH